jgi:hypothetical protein
MDAPVLRSTGVFLIFAENQFAMREIIQLVLWLWQMPQNIIGEILAFYYGGCTSFYRTGRYNRVAVVSSDRMRGGISLGNIIILPEFFSDKTLKHELGHCRQSLYLGWLYLIIIGLPSIIWAALYGIPKIRERYSYYDFYTERLANNLGSVTDMK